MGYLTHSRGKTWQDQLARYFSGDMTEEMLGKSAASTGQRVEYEYYSAILALAGDKPEVARAKLEKVISSDLLGFFEYRMARAILVSQFGED